MTRAGNAIFDRQAERAVVGAAIHSARWRRQLADLVEPAHFWFPAHGALFAACADLDDLGPFAAVGSDPEELWPLTFPSSPRVRAGAVGAVCELHVPAWGIARIAACADGNHTAAAAVVVERWERRREITEMRARIRQLESGAG